MGLLFHGLPGCGKTSTLKAIANHTQRHIVSVPLNRIKTSKHLLEIFYQEQLNHMNVPLSKRLYVIEDIDCSELKDIVGDRSSSAHPSNEDQDSGNGSSRSRSISDDDAQNFLNLIRASSHKAMDNLDKDKKELTLAGLLEVLDGVMEMDGRMMVMIILNILFSLFWKKFVLSSIKFRNKYLSLNPTLPLRFNLRFET